MALIAWRNQAKRRLNFIKSDVLERPDCTVPALD
jgi:hypothetical protein